MASEIKVVLFPFSLLDSIDWPAPLSPKTKALSVLNKIYQKHSNSPLSMPSIRVSSI